MILFYERVNVDVQLVGRIDLDTYLFNARKGQPVGFQYFKYPLSPLLPYATSTMYSCTSLAKRILLRNPGYQRYIHLHIFYFKPLDLRSLMVY
jgi:hypothetical protein